MMSRGHDIGAGIRNQLNQDASINPAIRVLDGAFMVIQQAIAIQQGQPLAVGYLNRWINELTSSNGLDDLARSHQLSGGYTIPRSDGSRLRR